MQSYTAKQFVKFPTSVLFVCILCAFGLEAPAQEFKSIYDGVEYAHVDHKLGSDPVRINLLRLDLKKVRLDVRHANDAAIGMEKTSAIAMRHRAVAAINAGFFRLDKSVFAGDASGILMIDGKLLSESSNDRSAVGIRNDKNRTEVNFGRLASRIVIGYGKDSIFSFDGINRQRKAGEIILFTPEFHQNTLTESNGTEIVLTRCSIREFRWLCRKAEVKKNQGSSPIPRDGLVISIAAEAAERSSSVLYFAERARSTPGDLRNGFTVIRQVRALQPDTTTFFAQAEDITNGVPQLIRNGRIDITWKEEKAGRAFVETRHPRTAVAKLKDGKFLMIAVDGRQPGVSVGMTLNELAEYLLGIGTAEAMNLDGGGSTTMFLDGKVVNQPSDKEGERKVGDAIVVTLRRNRR